MCFRIYWQSVCCAALLTPLAVLAQTANGELKSDWLDLVKGYRGETMGVELAEIGGADEEGTRKITLSIPKTSMQHPDDIEEVVVLGRKPEEPEPLLDLRFEWLDDYDEDNYGLVIYLRKGSNWPIRLFMSSESGYIR